MLISLFFFLEGDVVCNVFLTFFIFLASHIWPWSFCSDLQWKVMPSRSICILHDSLATIISNRLLNYLLLLSSYSYDAFTNASAHWWIYLANPILDASTEWEFLMNHRVSSFPFFKRAYRYPPLGVMIINFTVCPGIDLETCLWTVFVSLYIDIAFVLMSIIKSISSCFQHFLL